MSFLEALYRAKGKKQNIVIPDIKCVSPKDGDLMRGRNPVVVAKELIKAGAPVLSVVTEEKNFGGSTALLREIAALGVPVLRKDFLTTKEEIQETKELGASAVLLMYSCLEAEQLKNLYFEARRIGLDVLVEAHTIEEFEQAVSLGARLIGINNRDITILETDDGTVNLTTTLAQNKPKDVFLISESSIKNADEVRHAVDAGADAVLIGTAILQSEHPAMYYSKLCRKTSVKLCGMMSKENVEQCFMADVVGFVVNYPEPVPWNISEIKAKELIAGVPKDCKTCVVTGGSSEEVIRLAKELMPDYVQLHHREDFETTEQITKELKRFGVKVIRSIPLGAQARCEQFGIADMDLLIDELASVGVSMVLLDSRTADNASSENLEIPDVDLSRLKNKKIPFMIAGGISAEKFPDIAFEDTVDYIDIMTGIELSPGIKSQEKIKKLFDKLEETYE